MQTASAAGMFAVGATWGYRPAGELIAHGAKVLIDRPSQLLDLLDA
jgi:phosphoglycolate phosphatase